MERTKFTSLKEACIYQCLVTNQRSEIHDLQVSIERYLAEDTKCHIQFIERLFELFKVFNYGEAKDRNKCLETLLV